MKRILLVKTSSLGDVIHNLPVVNDILTHFPESKIDWVVEESFADIPKLHPNVNQVFTVAMRRWRKKLFKRTTWQEVFACKKSLSAQPYDFIIDTQGLIKSAVIARAAAGELHGYDKSSIREPFASRFYQHAHAIPYQQHAVIRNRTLVALSLGYTPPSAPPDYGIVVNTAHSLTMNSTLPQAYVVALHGTSRDSKLWPQSHWIALGKHLEAQGLHMALPWSNEAEYQRATAISQQLSNATVLPKLNIPAIASIISQATAAVGVDTGLSHLAVALNVPTVAIYTDTNPALTGIFAGSTDKAINLGGKHQVPDVNLVIQALEKTLLA